MSNWTYVKGVVEVSPFGRTQDEKGYILATVLAHLPKVTESENDMYVHILKRGGYNEFSSHDEFDEWRERGIRIQGEYMVVVEGALRDRDANTTYREFMKWLMRFAKRIRVESCFVRIRDSWSNTVKIIDRVGLEDYMVSPSWMGEGTVNWCEYLMWSAPRYRGRRLRGKPDFSDGSRIDLMTELQRNNRLGINKKKGGGVNK